MKFYKRNVWPEVIDKTWEKTPKEGQRVVISYGTSINENAWFRNGRFVNCFGFELENVIGWAPYGQQYPGFEK